MYELNVAEINNIAGGTEAVVAEGIQGASWDFGLTSTQMQTLLMILTQSTINNTLKDSNKAVLITTNLIGSACSMVLGNYLFNSANKN